MKGVVTSAVERESNSIQVGRRTASNGSKRHTYISPLDTGEEMFYCKHTS
jgi:hypothetical protein